MLTRGSLVVALALLLSALRIAAVSGDCRRSETIEFWSNLVCSMENRKTVSMHRPLDAGSGGGDPLVRRCFDGLVYEVARRCEAAILTRTYALPTSGNATSSSSADAVKRSTSSSIRRIAFDDAFRRSMPEPTADRTIPMSPGDVHGQNTWQVHVLLARDVQAFERVSAKNDSTFRWNSQDRFVVLIAGRQQRGGNGSADESEDASRIDGVLRALWRERGVHNVLVSVASLLLASDAAAAAARADRRVVRTYNPFARVNDTAWGEIELVSVNTTHVDARASNVLSNLTRRRLKNLNGYELQVGIFGYNGGDDDDDGDDEPSRETTARSKTSAMYFDVSQGFDDTMLETVARSMNFAARRVSPTDNMQFGYQLPNGMYVGAIGDVVHGRTDVCFKSFFVKKYSDADVEQVEFTTHVEFDGLCVMAPKASKIPKWLRIYHLFPPSVWLCSMFSNVLTYVTWYYLRLLDPRRTEKRVSFFATVYRMFLLNAGCPQKLPSANAERILLTGIFLASITLVGVFNGILYNCFARDMYYEDIDSLEALDASGLPVAYSSVSVNDLFGPATKDIEAPQFIRHLKNKLVHDHNSWVNVAYRRNVSALTRERHFPVVSEDFTDPSGAPLLHLLKECPRRFYLSYLLPKNSILRDRINVLISRLNEAGLPTLWNGRTIQRIIVEKKLRAREQRARKESDNGGFVAFSLSDVQTSFYMLLTGLSLATLVFFRERGWLRAPLSRDDKSSSRPTLIPR